MLRAACTREEVDAAYASAKVAQRQWAKTPLYKRAEILHKAAAILRENAQPIADCLGEPRPSYLGTRPLARACEEEAARCKLQLGVHDLEQRLGAAESAAADARQQLVQQHRLQLDAP